MSTERIWEAIHSMRVHSLLALKKTAVQPQKILFKKITNVENMHKKSTFRNGEELNFFSPNFDLLCILKSSVGFLAIYIQKKKGGRSYDATPGTLTWIPLKTSCNCFSNLVQPWAVKLSIRSQNILVHFFEKNTQNCKSFHTLNIKLSCNRVDERQLIYKFC